MGKINILQPNVFNMIAAGEVVERPSSVVKELIENAIDAGATIIDVDIEEGGIKRIQVSDNGIGILPEDIRTAFLPHSTSKLKNIEDLDSIATLGFRGEALASIASVSEITLVSKHSSVETASKIELSGGKITLETADSRSQGTTITVNNLFFNTPARLKFLKKASCELHYITDTVKMLALANPNIALTLNGDGSQLLAQEGGDLQDALYSVYDAKTVSNLYEVDYISHSNITVKGFTSSVDFTKPNRTYQTVIVNGRAVSDLTITTAVEKAYSEYLMKRTYPMFVLDIIVPFDDVDVNVHPSKTEVRFRDKQAVFGAVYHAIGDAIAKNTAQKQFGFDIGDSADRETGIEDNFTKNSAAAADIAKDNGAPISYKTENDSALQSVFNKNSSSEKIKYSQARIDTASLFFGKKAPSNYGNFNDFGNKNTVFGDSGTTYETDFSKNPTNCDADGKSDFAQSLSDSKENDSIFNTSIRIFDGEIIGQIFDTYIIVERDEQVYIIDQHAAHERILYDRLSKKLSAEYAQSLLIPYKFKLSGVESEYFDKILPTMNQMGFEIEFQFGNYVIYALPEPIAKMDISKFLSEIFKNMMSEKDFSMDDILKDNLCQQACKAAIKGGDHLNREQIERVLKNFVDSNGALPEKCPHGRPAVVSVTKTDIEKLFKRIV